MLAGCDARCPGYPARERDSRRILSYGPDPVVVELAPLVRSDFLSEPFDNLPARLAVLKRDPATKARILEHLRDLGGGFDDIEIVPEGGRLQLYLTEGPFSLAAHRLSDGTLRYLALLAVLLDPQPPPHRHRGARAGPSLRHDAEDRDPARASRLIDPARRHDPLGRLLRSRAQAGLVAPRRPSKRHERRGAVWVLPRARPGGRLAPSLVLGPGEGGRGAPCPPAIGTAGCARA